MEQAVTLFALIHLLIMGVSHIAAPHVWIEYFIRLREQGERGVFVVGFMSLGFGSIIVAFHPVWSGWPLILTLLGCAQVLKAAIYFIWPQYGLRKMQRVSPERPRDFVIAGVGLLVISALVAVPLFQ